MRRISLDRYLIQERTNGVSIIHRDSGKEWRFNVDTADDTDMDVVRQGEAVSNDELDGHAAESSNVHGIAENDAVAGIADIMREIQLHSDKDSGVHGANDGDRLATEASLDGKADSPHGDEDHSIDYAHASALREHNNASGGVHGIPSTDTIATIRHVEQQADSPHGNEEHSEEFATITDLDEKAGGIHGNESHEEEYITGITALNDTASLGTINTINFRDNFSIQTDGNELILDSQGGVSSDEFTTHTNNASAHHSRYTDEEARNALSDITDGFIPSSGGTTTGPIIQEHDQNIRTHEWTHAGNAPSPDGTAYLLIAETGPGVRMVGSLVGVRGSSSNRSYSNIGISFGSNTDTSPTAHGSITRLEAWAEQGPVFDFKVVEYESAEYYALELSASGFVNYDQGIYFSGLTRNASMAVVGESDIVSVRDDNIMNDTFGVGNEEVYHTGNVNPSEEGHTHSGETISPQRVEAQEIQLPTYPSGNGQGNIWLVE